MLPRPYYTDQDIRKKQIDTLKVFNDNVLEINENCEYRVDFSAGGRNMSLNVILSPEFPNVKPIIFIVPTVQHPWLAENSNQVLGAPGLLNYTIHSDLGRVVQAIIREFQKSLPEFACSEIVPTVTNETSPRLQSSEQSLTFPWLKDLSTEELQEILENTDLQDKSLETNPQLFELEAEAEELMASIEEIARDNIAKQQQLDYMKSKVLERISGMIQMKINYEELNKKYQELCEMYDPHRIRDCLKAAAMKADEDAEVIAEQFLLGQIPVETFVSKFAEKRALGQARRTKEERLAHQLAQLDKATT